MTVKVLHIIDHLAFGGGQYSLKSIVENIDDSETECIVCALRPKPETIPINAKVITLNYGRFDPRTIIAVLQLCKEHKIDILHAHLDKSIITCLLANFIRKIPVVAHERGGISIKGFSFSLYRFFFKFLHRKAAVIIANSQAISLELQNKAGVNKNRIKVIYNPVDFSIFDPDKVSRKESRKNLAISEKDFVVGYVGRFHPMKGVDILIKAFASLLKKSPRYLLVLAGDGPERKSLEKLVEKLNITERVRFLGMCENVPEIMAAFDVAVMPSRIEPFGRVAIELMRMKKPLICSGIDGLAEIVTDGQTGIITEQNTPEQIAAAIERFANDKGLREELIKNAFNFSENFDVHKHVKKIEQIYKEVISVPKS